MFVAATYTNQIKMFSEKRLKMNSITARQNKIL